MALEFQKELSNLKAIADTDREGLLPPFRTYLVLLILVWATFFLFTLVTGARHNSTAVSTYQKEFSSGPTLPSQWAARTLLERDDRILWLKKYGLLSGIYEKYSAGCFLFFISEKNSVTPDQKIGMTSVEGMKFTVFRFLTDSSLDFGFLLIAGTPVWVAGFFVGRLFGSKHWKPLKNKDILGICDPGVGPFYSGIYGPLNPNGSFSGTDYSCPSLVCPPTLSSDKIKETDLYSILESAGAVNKTNKSLLGIILAHSNYPARVPEEGRHEDDHTNVIHETEEFEHVEPPTKALIKIDHKTLEWSTRHGLSAVCRCHATLKSLLDTESFDSFENWQKTKEQLADDHDPLAKTLLTSLSAEKGKALAEVPINLLVSAYLATEAGKSLVFSPVGDGFTQVSNYPHLQARAVIQSIPEYHEEYDGDQRMNLRQAIITSRKHGDFGRTFLLRSMTAQSKAIRDFLEILGSEPGQVMTTGELVELTSHLETVKKTFAHGFVADIKNQFAFPDQSKPFGFLHHNVVLVPVKKCFSFGLAMRSNEEIEHIYKLCVQASKVQEAHPITTRMPGVKQNFDSAISRKVPENSCYEWLVNENKMFEQKWHILRRTLIYYNWLSSKLDDRLVPEDGLVAAAVPGEDGVAQYIYACVPLRKRRIAEILGAEWEHTSNPFGKALRVHLTPAELNGKLN